MVLDPISMCARGCGSSQGLLHTPIAGKKKEVRIMLFENLTSWPLPHNTAHRVCYLTSLRDPLSPTACMCFRFNQV